MRSHDPLSRGARTELERLGRRWQQLPLDQALARVHLLRRLAQEFADEAATATGSRPAGLPDLGPAAAYDQLVVTAYDLASVRCDQPREGAEADEVELRLASLRRDI